MRHALLPAALLALAGCATTAPSANDAVVASAAPAPGAPQQVCRKETKVGSQIPTTVCEAAMTEAERNAQMQRVQDQIRSQNTAAHQGIGGG